MSNSRWLQSLSEIWAKNIATVRRRVEVHIQYYLSMRQLLKKLLLGISLIPGILHHSRIFIFPVGSVLILLY